MNHPTRDDFKSYSDRFYTFIKSTQTLFINEEKIKIEWLSFLDEPVFIWIQNQEGFKSALKTLSRASIISTPDLDSHDAIYLSNVCSSVFQILLHGIDHQLTPKITKKSIQKAALKPTIQLIELLSNDLQMENLMDGIKLRQLLERLKDELTDEAPTSYPKENKGSLIDKEVITQLYDLLISNFNKASTTAIIHLCSLYGLNIEDRQIKRHLKDHRQYIDRLETYKRQTQGKVPL
ncbi:MAG: hypothetical protein DIZ80_03225 [endosymbiont of Galathealinum brachiosum]|uniref:Uncharacterized protein n=1 Tax=endosymbiont of Galathealinum brachiosum TaxID=2200906 RepID=A0A370DHV3_9GAMM|nr:MAG: hypothetical protein DIZ80_03225 [endosymbiont of Galathealinum brachiosum]